MRPCGFMPPGRFCVLMGLLRVMLARSHSPVSLPAAFVSVTRQPTTETEVNMAIINLRDYYPFYTSDCFMEVSEEVAEMFKEFDRKEAAYRLRTYRHKAYYLSLIHIWPEDTGLGRAPTSRLCATCGHRGIACHLAAAPKMAQKNRGPYSGTSVSLAFLMPSAVASITTSSFSFMEFRRTSMCFLQELDLAPPSA